MTQTIIYEVNCDLCGELTHSQKIHFDPQVTQNQLPNLEKSDYVKLGTKHLDICKSCRIPLELELIKVIEDKRKDGTLKGYRNDRHTN